MLRLRILTAVIGLPLLIALFVMANKWWLLLAFSVFIAWSIHEMTKMMVPRLERAFRVMRHHEVEGNTGGLKQIVEALDRVSPIVCMIIGVWIFLITSLPEDASAQSITSGVAFGFMILIFVSIFSANSTEQAMARMLGGLISVVYGAYPWIAIWALHLMGPEARYIFLLLAIVWGGDTGGYFGGRFFGRHKMAPRLSPKKTWEGAAAGLILSVVAALGLNHFFQEHLAPNWLIASIAVVGGISGQFGDLIESSFKRFCGIKDSGKLLPGHGGLLDRIDGVLFAAPFVWFMLHTLR